MNKIALQAIKWYQSLSKLTPASCRYYPTCSEYAKWLYEFDNPLLATLKSAKRIATCNQLFAGGIDYPKAKYKKIEIKNLCNIIKREDLPYKPLKFKEKKSSFRIKYWLVPKDNYYYIIKDFDATATYVTTGYAPTSSPR
jgi:putative membrane protein insertion efficiency factor